MKTNIHSVYCSDCRMYFSITALTLAYEYLTIDDKRVQATYFECPYCNKSTGLKFIKEIKEY